MNEELEELIRRTSGITHKVSLTINSEMSDADCEEIAKSLEALANGVRRIPVIRKMNREE